MARVKCSRCGRRFPQAAHAEQHIKSMHGKRGGEVIPDVPSEREESLADIFVQAEIDRSMGLPVEDWIEDSMS